LLLRCFSQAKISAVMVDISAMVLSRKFRTFSSRQSVRLGDRQQPARRGQEAERLVPQCFYEIYCAFR
jgi:hypothetical protein